MLWSYTGVLWRYKNHYALLPIFHFFLLRVLIINVWQINKQAIGFKRIQNAYRILLLDCPEVNRNETTCCLSRWACWYQSVWKMGLQRYELCVEHVRSHLDKFLGAFSKLRKATLSFVMSVCPSVHPRGATRLPLGGFSRNLIFECFSEICWENSSLIKLWKE
jgi:hypothetical protein